MGRHSRGWGPMGTTVAQLYLTAAQEAWWPWSEWTAHLRPQRYLVSGPKVLRVRAVSEMVDALAIYVTTENRVTSKLSKHE